MTTTEIYAAIGFWIVAPSSYSTDGNQLVILVKNESGTRQFEVLTTPWYSIAISIDAETNHFKFSSNTWDTIRMAIRKIR